MDIPSLEGYLVLFLVIALLTMLVTHWIAVPYTLGLVVVGLGISLFGILPDIHLTSELVLSVFLPALLFEGAWSMRWDLVRRHWRVIFFLAGPGLLLSLVLIASILHLLDGLDWGTAFLLAAIISPTDPVAVLSLFRQLHIDERLSEGVQKGCSSGLSLPCPLPAGLSSPGQSFHQESDHAQTDHTFTTAG